MSAAFDLRHALAVASRVDGLDAKLVAILHDAVEDGACTLSDLLDADLPDEVINAVDLLTRAEPNSQGGPAYDDYIRTIKASGDELAIYVKIADVEANLARMDEEHASLAGRYRRAQTILGGTG